MSNIPNDGKGRPPGFPNKRSLLFQQTLEKNNFNPAETMIELYKIALENFIQDREREASGKISPMESHAVGYLKIASDHVMALASYTYPKLKSIETVKTSTTDGMSSQEKIAAAKAIIEILEKEANDAGSS